MSQDHGLDDAQTSAAGAFAADLSSVGLTHIDHIGIAVHDLDEAIKLYETVFGMRCVHIEENIKEGVREAMMSVGSGPSVSRVQLLGSLSAGSSIARFLDQSGPGLQQIAYAVTDVDETSALLRARGVRLLYETAQRGTADSRVNFVHPKDVGGVLVELVEPAARVGTLGQCQGDGPFRDSTGAGVGDVG